MGLAGLKCPRMDWETENLPERWKRFRQHVELMFSGPLIAKKEEEKCSYWLIWCGEKGRDIANTWSDVTDEDKKKLKKYFERFANHPGQGIAIDQTYEIPQSHANELNGER